MRKLLVMVAVVSSGSSEAMVKTEGDCVLAPRELSEVRRPGWVDQMADLDLRNFIVYDLPEYLPNALSVKWRGTLAGCLKGVSEKEALELITDAIETTESCHMDRSGFRDFIVGGQKMGGETDETPMTDMDRWICVLKNVRHLHYCWQNCFVWTHLAELLHEIGENDGKKGYFANLLQANKMKESMDDILNEIQDDVW